ncbi:MAG: alpha/beta hydrolase [Clostridia bacterium]|nr:alpha/beta hydrolase [Clostridia bacterium]
MITSRVRPEIDYEKHGLVKGSRDVYVDCYVSEPTSDDPLLRPAVVILPGGGYWFCSPRESEPIALAFAAKGYAAFVLNYSIETGEFPAQLLEAAWTVDFVRRNAEKWRIIPNRIAVCGFSAGGHLAASVGTMWNAPEVRDVLGFRNGEGRPDAMILAYPVISTGEFIEWGSIMNLTQRKAETDPALMARLSLENAVDDATPPAFIWHTADDTCVKVENSLLFASALSKQKIPFELHILPKGEHGLSLCDPSVDVPRERAIPWVTGWVESASVWLDRL